MFAQDIIPQDYHYIANLIPAAQYRTIIHGLFEFAIVPFGPLVLIENQIFGTITQDIQPGDRYSNVAMQVQQEDL